MITCEEKFDSREVTTGGSGSAILTYIIKGTDDDQAALTELAATAPAAHSSMPRISRTVEPIGPDMWLGIARYGWQGQNDTGDSLFSFDTGGGTQHITQSIATVNSYAPAGESAPDFNGAVGVVESNVEGVDITVPVFNFAETHYLDDSDVDSAYQQALFELTGKVNNAAWRWFYTGEVLFLGAAGSKRGRGDWEITFRFAASMNRSGVNIGPITGISKKGWEYLWVRYRDTEHSASGTIAKEPVAVYIEQVYEYGSFALLGI